MVRPAKARDSRWWNTGEPIEKQHTGDANVKGRNTKRELFPAPKNSRYLKVPCWMKIHMKIPHLEVSREMEATSKAASESWTSFHCLVDIGWIIALPRKPGTVPLW